MLTSPEEYLSGLTFDLPERGEAEEKLNSFEKAFVEKYLGLNSVANEPAPPRPIALPVIEIAPEPLPQLQPVRKEQTQPVRPVLEPTIEIAQETTPKAAITIEVAEATQKTVVAEPPPPAPAITRPVAGAQSADRMDTVKEEIDEAPAPAQTAVAARADAPPELTLREKMRAESEVQMVSFFVENQLFLLPVAAIHEVIRHMELIKVPQAPDFVAGAINLRGNVIPIVHLSSLLTNAAEHFYDEKKFIIICGTENLRLGLIIDRISSMHLLPQDKIIWNAEAKLGEAADFLYAIVNLNEKVCGVVAPELIAQKIISP